MRNGCSLLSGKGNLCTSSLRGLLGNNTCLKSGLVCLSVCGASINQYLICRKQCCVLVSAHRSLIPVEKSCVLLTVTHRLWQELHSLVGGVNQNWLQVMNKHGENLCPNSLSASACCRICSIAVHTVLSCVQITVGKLNDVIVEGTEDVIKAISLVSLSDCSMNLAHTCKNKTVILFKVRYSNCIGSRIKLALELAKKEAQGVSEPTVCIAYLGKNGVIARNVS